MLAWVATLWAMKGYELDGKRIKEIQATNTARKAYIAEWRKGAIEILEGVRIQRPGGSIVPLKKKTDK